MGGSGTSGALRFKNGAGEEFLVTLGIHNYNAWCDVVTDLAPGDTGLKIHTEYYTEGTTVDVKFVTQRGNDLVVHITIS
ncbi:hypothetical protein BDR05DRAFT_965313 [Suillus weaverae]|nr:hypothetical protein BDR05DRAFT_965313 [Suillus weaverae]